MLASLSCDALINFYGAFLKDGNIGVILEFMDRGSLEILLDRDVQLTEACLAAMAFQVQNCLMQKLLYFGAILIGESYADHVGSRLFAL